MRIISDQSDEINRTIEFEISESDRNVAIQTLVKYIDDGNVVTVADNRDKREGSISLKRQDGEYLRAGGGHGFSNDWKTISLKDVCWLLKVTAPFNYGGDRGNHGSIKNS